MPSLEEHVRRSRERTGKDYREVHEFLDGNGLSYATRIWRHIEGHTKKGIANAKLRFGEDGAREYLQHLNEDCKQNFLLKGVERLLAACHTKPNRF